MSGYPPRQINRISDQMHQISNSIGTQRGVVVFYAGPHVLNNIRIVKIYPKEQLNRISDQINRISNTVGAQRGVVVFYAGPQVLNNILVVRISDRTVEPDIRQYVTNIQLRRRTARCSGLLCRPTRSKQYPGCQDIRQNSLTGYPTK